MYENVATISDTRSTTEVVDGRITIAAETDNATLYVRVPEHDPLSEIQPVAQLEIVGDDFETDLELTGDDVADLVEALAGDGDA